MQQPFPEHTPSPEAILAFAMITAAYLFLVVVVALSSRVHDLRLIGIGLLTGVASIGYASIVSGGAFLVAPLLMKIAFLLILGGLVTRLLSESSRSGVASPAETHHE